MDEVLLSNLTDEQKALLTMLAYVNYDRSKLNKISKNKFLTISDLYQAPKIIHNKIIKEETEMSG